MAAMVAILDFLIGMILAILIYKSPQCYFSYFDLQVTPMLPTKFQVK